MAPPRDIPSMPPPFPQFIPFETFGRRPRADAGIQYERMLHLSKMLACPCETTNFLNLKEAVDTEGNKRDEPELTVRTAPLLPPRRLYLPSQHSFLGNRKQVSILLA